MGRMDNKLAIVTGANSGMGMATVEALSDEGAKVIMLCRSEKDLGDYASIRSFISQVKEKYKKLDVLVNNAGFISLDRQETKEGLERQFGINHIGHFLLTTELVDIMDRGSRIVNVASGAHKTGKIHFDDINLTRGYNVIKGYSQSKLAKRLYEFSEQLVSG